MKKLLASTLLTVLIILFQTPVFADDSSGGQGDVPKFQYLNILGDVDDSASVSNTSVRT